MSDLFVLANKNIHLILRFLAIVGGLILVYHGNKCKNNYVIAIGFITIIVDSFTFCVSIKQLRKK